MLQKLLKKIKKKTEKGFTMIELLLVISVIAVLSGIVILAVNPSQQFIAAVDAQRSSTREIKNAIFQYATDESVLPTTIPTGESNALPICREEINPTINNCVDLSALTPTYLVEIPEDPGETNPAITGYSIYKNSGDLITVSTENAGEKSLSIDIVTDGLVAWWKSDEGTGTNVLKL